jgi:outer membrane protein, heavy metal efflux system
MAVRITLAAQAAFASWLFAAFCSAPAQGRELEPVALPPLDLQAVTAAARANRGEIQAALARASALAQRPAIVGALEDPMISPAIDHYPFDMMDEGGSRFDWSISVEQSFPLSGIRGHRRRAALAEAQRADSEAERSVLEVVLQAQRAFFMSWERQEMRTVLERQLALALQVARSAAARYASGTGSQADLLRAEVEVARVQAAQRALASQIRAAQSMLNVAMGVPASSPLGELAYSDAAPPLPPATTVERTALSSRPELRMGQTEVERALAEMQVMRSMYRPMATIRVGRASTMAEGPGGMLMVGVSVPIWRDKLHAGVAEARSMERMARADLEAMQLMIAGEALAAREELAATRETVRSLEREILPRAELAIEAALAAYAAGNSLLVSVLDASGALWQARAELVMARAQAGVAAASFERALGSGTSGQPP